MFKYSSVKKIVAINNVKICSSFNTSGDSFWFKSSWENTFFLLIKMKLL